MRSIALILIRLVCIPILLAIYIFLFIYDNDAGLLPVNMMANFGYLN